MVAFSHSAQYLSKETFYISMMKLDSSAKKLLQFQTKLKNNIRYNEHFSYTCMCTLSTVFQSEDLLYTHNTRFGRENL